jgi:hypothetical protein
MSRTPWVGLAAFIAMFVIPYLPPRFFEGPRTVKHWPRRHVCGECGGPWTDDHTCMPTSEIRRSVRGELLRLERTADSDRVADSQTVSSPSQGMAWDPLTSRQGPRDPLDGRRPEQLARMS